jgi:hypothetical protein
MRMRSLLHKGLAVQPRPELLFMLIQAPYFISMQPTRSLFQTVYKIPKQPLVRGVSKSRPFFNAWAPPSSTLQARAMSSATSFYDFKPLNSKSPLYLFCRSSRSTRSTPLTHTPHYQRKGNPSPSQTIRTKLSSSSTRPQNAASHLNTKDLRSSTNPSKRNTPKTSQSSASHATNSAAKSPGPTTTFSPSARSTTASRSPSWARRKSMAIMRSRCLSG